MAKTFASEHPDLEGLTQAEFCYCIWELCRAANELERLFWRVGDDEPPTGPWAEAIQDGMESGTLTEAPEITPTLHYDPRLSKWYCQDGTEKSEPSFEEFIADYEGGDRALSCPWPENISQISVSFGENVRRVFAACRKLVYLHPYHYELGEDTRFEFQFEARLFDPITGGAIKYLTQLHLQPPDSLPELIDDGEPDFPWYDEELIESFSVQGTLLFDNKDYGDLPESFQHEEYPWWWGGEDLPDWLELTGDTDPEYVPTNIYPGYRGGLPEWVRYLREVLLAMTNVVWVIGDHRPFCSGSTSAAATKWKRDHERSLGDDGPPPNEFNPPWEALHIDNPYLAARPDTGPSENIRIPMTYPDNPDGTDVPGHPAYIPTTPSVQDAWRGLSAFDAEEIGELPATTPPVGRSVMLRYADGTMEGRAVIYVRPIFEERYRAMGGAVTWKHGDDPPTPPPYTDDLEYYSTNWHWPMWLWSWAFGLYPTYYRNNPYIPSELPHFCVTPLNQQRFNLFDMCTKYTFGEVVDAKRALLISGAWTYAPIYESDQGTLLTGTMSDGTLFGDILAPGTGIIAAPATRQQAIKISESWDVAIGSQTPVGEFSREETFTWLDRAQNIHARTSYWIGAAYWHDELERWVAYWIPMSETISYRPPNWRGDTSVALRVPKRPGAKSALGNPLSLFDDISGSRYLYYSHVITDISSDLSYVNVEPEEPPE